MGVIALLLAGCARLPVPPQGHWSLERDGVAVGELLLAGRSCRAGLWSEHVATGGDEAVRCVAVLEEGGWWIYLPALTAAGPSELALHVDVGAAEATLPLGVRPGEHTWTLALVSGQGPPLEARRRARAAVSSAGDAWDLGVLQLREGERLVGVVEAGTVPTVRLCDRAQATDGAVPARRTDVGPEWVLDFAVMPSLEGEGGRLRINRVLGLAVAPLGADRTALDRRYTVVPGRPPDQAWEAACAASVQASLQAERAALAALLPEVAAAGCELASLPEGLTLALAGYAVHTAGHGASCRVDVDPEPPQHGRRLAATWTLATGLEVLAERR